MFQLNALAKNIFKAPVCVVLPTEKIDDNGETVTAEAHFIATFQSVSEAEAEVIASQLDGATDNDIGKLNKLLKAQLESIFIGFEKHPKHPFPFKDGDTDVVASPDSIRLLLNSKEVADALRAAYNKARAGEAAKKNLKK